MKVLSAISTALICFTTVVFAEGPQYLGIDLSENKSGMYSLEAFDDVPPGGWSSRHKTDMIVLRRVEMGQFLMTLDETNKQEVAISKPYYIGVFEITRRQYELVMGESLPYSSYRDPEAAVDRLSWECIRSNTNHSHSVTILSRRLPPSGIIGRIISFFRRPIDITNRSDAAFFRYDWPTGRDVAPESFIGRLRAKTSCGGIDLPTEAQWEHACLYGEDAKPNEVHYDLAKIGNFATGKHAFSVKKVGLYEPNKIGLYDMYGNVLEWCLDYRGAVLVPGLIDPEGPEFDNNDRSSNDRFRVLRGGTYSLLGEGCRICLPHSISSSRGLGFRIVINDVDKVLSQLNIQQEK